MNTQTIRAAFSDRLHSILDEREQFPRGDGRQVALGRAFKVSQTAARKWLTGEAMPETTRIIEIADRFGVAFEWLVTGRGPKYPLAAPFEAEVQTAVQRRYASASSSIKALIELCLELPLSVPLPDAVSPTLKNPLQGARQMAEQNLPRA